MQEITAEQLRQRLETGEQLQIIDVREPFEWDIVNLEKQGARLIPLAELPDRLDELDRDTDIVVYCRSGGRSSGAVQHLEAIGFERVYNLKGGIKGWVKAIDPSLPTY